MTTQHPAIRFYLKVIELHHQQLEQQKDLFNQFIRVENKLLKIVNPKSNHINVQHSAPLFNDEKAIPKDEDINLNDSKSLFNYEQLITHAVGKVSSLFGAEFKPVDEYPKRVRLPAPPFLLIDRVISMTCNPASQEPDTIETEIDLSKDKWFLHEGYIPFSILLECAQGHLFLVSRQGWDLKYQGKKISRMLGGTIELLGTMPRLGDTVTYKIYANKQYDQSFNLFTLEYQCYVRGELRLIVKDAKVGLFDEQQLQNSSGILWDPAKVSCISNSSIPTPLVSCQQKYFSRNQIEAFANGDTYTCFGPGFEYAQTHVHSPRIPNGRLLVLNEIQEFDTKGGPWQRGYIRSTQTISPDDWFFKLHFINDPVMPGTIIIEAFLQTMAFYITGMGYTLDKDGWRFEVVTNNAYTFLGRGQVLPSTKEVIYEVFIEEIIAKPFPTIFASVLATTFAGTKIYLLNHFGVRLVPDNPLSRYPELIQQQDSSANVVIDEDGISLDRRSLLEFALGNPSRTFGEKYKIHDLGKKMPRTPAPPFQFTSRVVELVGKKGVCRAGASASIEYDVPADAWYFKENYSFVMPFCVLLEAALQSAGWLSIYIGTVLQTEQERFIRNLNGTLKLIKDVKAIDCTIKTKVRVSNISSASDMQIETFDFECYIGDQMIAQGTSSFGFFSKDSLKQQIGIQASESHNEIYNLPSNININILEYNNSKAGLSLANDRLKMIDHINGYWAKGGSHGLGALRAEKNVSARDWFFKAHFYRDPVQPGSLGLEGMLQLLQFYLLEQSDWQDFVEPCFELPALGSTINWKYRGQVLSHHTKIIYTMEVLSVTKTNAEVIATANASLWVEDKRIYEAELSIRLYDRDKS